MNTERGRIIAISDVNGEFVTDEDGFVYYWPDGSTRGHYASHHLRWLADELDKRNAAWNKVINERGEL